MNIQIVTLIVLTLLSAALGGLYVGKRVNETTAYLGGAILFFASALLYLLGGLLPKLL